MKPWITYTLIRVGLFAAFFALLYGVLSLEGWIAAIIAATLGLCVSYIFLRPQRDRAINSVTARPSDSADEAAED